MTSAIAPQALRSSSGDEALLPLVLDVPEAFSTPQPVASGLPLPRGFLREPHRLVVRTDDGQATPAQGTVLASWPDGSVKWLLVETILRPRTPGVAAGSLLLETQKPTECLSTRVRSDSILVRTGAIDFLVRRGTPAWLEATVGGRPLLEPSGLRVVLSNRPGREEQFSCEALSVESSGPIRSTVRLEGRFSNGLRLVVRFCFFTETGLVRLRLTLHNPARARHRGGLWDLGDRGARRFRDLSVVVPLKQTEAGEVCWKVQPEQPFRSVRALHVLIEQASSGGEHWKSRNHLDRDGQIPCPFKGYRVEAGGRDEQGSRARPTLVVRTHEAFVASVIPEFWQQFPKAFEADGTTLHAGLFPAHFGAPFELQGGEQKTHTLWLDFRAGDDGTPLPLDWVHHPARLGATARWNVDSGAIPYLTLAESRSRLATELAAVIEGPRSFAARRETIDEYGWRNYGEVYADHEAAYYTGEPPVISHYNNQYDVLLGLILQSLRSGDRRWFDLADPLARHVIDIDLYHTDRDKSAYNGGLFWHTDHYKDAATCTHRAYSQRNRSPQGGPYGGGPSNEHNYTTGLLHYYYLTGDDEARRAVLSLADWVVNMDDGRKNVLGFIDPGPTGYASQTAEPNYHGPGRGSGNSINALLDGWLISGKRSYLEAAEALIRRTVHPNDEISTHQLLNTEQRWSYTVHLSSVARYLELKQENGELDQPYAYARASLLHYAEWMLHNEVFYFERPEVLEYPTETWAAQELRKGNVLRFAADHASEPLASRLRARGNELADRAWSDLMAFETRDAARAVAILMKEGTLDAYFRARSGAPTPADVIAGDFGTPVAFVGQKARIRQAMKRPLRLGALLACALGARLGLRRP